MKENKVKFALYLPPEKKAELERRCQEDGCRSLTKFIGTVFTGVATEDAAQHAHDNWLKSPGHFETMIKPDCDSIGVGMTESGGVTYCFMIVGRPNTHNPYEP